MTRAADLCARLQARQRNDTSLGQHFLVEEAHLEHITALGGDLNGRQVLEIGPGPGTLTAHLLDAGAIVTAIEVDPVAVQHLESAFHEELAQGALSLVQGDALEVEWPEQVDAVVSNIPYQISSPLIDRLEAFRRAKEAPETVVLLVQEEFAERLCLATPADRGSLGICTALGWNASMDRRVPPGCFVPPPAVMSRVVVLQPKAPPAGTDQRLVRLVVHQAFDARRKKLRTSLKRPPRRIARVNGWHAERWRRALEVLQDDARLHLRPEDLDLEGWLSFCDDLCDAGVEIP